MSHLFSNNWLANRPIEKAMAAFAGQLPPHAKVLDIGCGNKPYAPFFKGTYIGLDPDPESQADVIGNAWHLPFPDASFDAIILNQSMEHIAETNETIAEIRRVLKSGCLAIITVPQTMKNHGVPLPSSEAPVHNFDPKRFPYWYVDYYRFTKYGLLYLFQDFWVISLKESNGYAASLFQLQNYFLASFGIDWLFRPVYFINNVLGFSLDWLAEFLRNLNIGIITKIFDLIYATLTINYIMVIRKQ
jgi:SAM-dependent methyltransferase